MVLWRISTQTKKYKADDISGSGAQLVGGRWNTVGTPMLYCAQSISLACLETMAHLNSEIFWLERYLIRIDVPNELADIFDCPDHADLPSHWHENPYSIHTSIFGSDLFNLDSSPGIILPSSIIQEENIVCLNPKHHRYSDISATIVRKWTYDERIVRIKSEYVFPVSGRRK